MVAAHDVEVSMGHRNLQEAFPVSVVWIAPDLFNIAMIAGFMSIYVLLSNPKLFIHLLGVTLKYAPSYALWFLSEVADSLTTEIVSLAGWEPSCSHLPFDNNHATMITGPDMAVATTTRWTNAGPILP